MFEEDVFSISRLNNGLIILNFLPECAIIRKMIKALEDGKEGEEGEDTKDGELGQVSSSEDDGGGWFGKDGKIIQFKDLPPLNLGLNLGDPGKQEVCTTAGNDKVSFPPHYQQCI